MMPEVCTRCHGTGQLRSPRWGERDCPDPTVDCPECGGLGGWESWADTEDAADDRAAEYLDDWRRGVA